MLMVVCSNTLSLSYLLYILINPGPLEVLHINDVLSGLMPYHQPHNTSSILLLFKFFNNGNDHVVFPKYFLTISGLLLKTKDNISVFQTRSQTNYDKHPGGFSAWETARMQNHKTPQRGEERKRSIELKNT